MHHPDVSNNPTSKETFRKASEAYAILANDRERYVRVPINSIHTTHTSRRRAYDRTLAQRSTPAPPGTSRSSSVESRRKPGATYAWQSTRRSRQPEHEHGPRVYPGPQQSNTASSPTGYSHYYAHLHSTKRETPQDRADRVSGAVRALQVIIAMTVVTMVCQPLLVSSPSPS